MFRITTDADGIKPSNHVSKKIAAGFSAVLTPLSQYSPSLECQTMIASSTDGGFCKMLGDCLGSCCGAFTITAAQPHCSYRPYCYDRPVRHHWHFGHHHGRHHHGHHYWW